MIFRRATLKLTITYTIVQLSFFAIFSIGIYSFVTGTFIFDGIRRASEAAFDASAAGAMLLRNGLIIFYLGLIVVVPVSSWLMARAALAPLRESYERQQQFVDGASHELRTPLSIIQGELELALSRSRSAREYREAMTVALDATAGLSALTDDLLKFSRTSRAAFASGFTTVDVLVAIRNAIREFTPQARQTGVELTFTKCVPAEVKGSAELLTRAIGNVIGNAIKFSRAGGVVTISVVHDSAHVVLQVLDNGVGMSRNEQERAFERFWRADSARSTPGHGLGLPLVKQIIKAHEGTVKLSSTPAEGTLVTITLPARG